MSKKELRRVEVIAQLEAGTLKTKEASELLGLSDRQVKRLRRTYRKKGAVGLAHGNRGKASPRRTEAHIREQVVELVTEKYRDYNNQHVQEILAERHEIGLSVSTIRRIRLAAGIGSPTSHPPARPGGLVGNNGNERFSICLIPASFCFSAFRIRPCPLQRNAL